MPAYEVQADGTFGSPWRLAPITSVGYHFCHSLEFSQHFIDGHFNIGKGIPRTGRRLLAGRPFLETPSLGMWSRRIGIVIVFV